MTSPTSSLIQQMQKFKDNYYNTEGKNSFFKKSQKLDCAKKMSETFELEQMLQKTVFQIPGTNKILFDYNVFKLYANPSNYETIIQYIIHLYDKLLIFFPSFETHIILDTFTISAAERYKSAIQIFCNKCINSHTKYSQCITQMNIYYTPIMIDSISTLLRPFIDKSVSERIKFYSKIESPQLLKKLFV